MDSDSLRCPRCVKPLSRQSVGDTSIDVCLACEGVWFDQGEIQRIIAAGPDYGKSALAASWSGAPRGDAPGPGRLSCPRCSLQMDRYLHEGKKNAPVDGCSNGCGVWVDDGEVRAIFGWARRVEAPPSGLLASLSQLPKKAGPGG